MTEVSVSASGSTFLSGSISGLNTQALIQNAVNAKLVPKQRLLDQVSVNTNKITAYQKLQTLSEAFKTSLSKLQSDPTNTGVYAQKQATFTSSNQAIAANTVLTSTLGSNAQAGTHEIIVNSVAKSFAASGSNQTNVSNALNFNGSFDIGEAGKTASTINVTSGMSIEDIRDAINTTTSTTGVRADILQVSTGLFSLVIRGADTNKAVAVSNITGDNVLNSLGVTDAGGNFTTITQAPQPASITIDNTIVTSDTNIFTNVLSGVTLNVLNAAPSTTISFTIGNNTDGVKSTILEMVNAYNALRANIDANKKVGADGVIDANAFLYGESINSNLGSAISGFVSGTYGNSSAYNGLRSLGITLSADGTLAIDDAALTTALKNNFNAVVSVFASNTANGTVGLADTAFANINAVSNTATGSIANVVKSLQDNNTSLKNRADEMQTSINAYQQALIDKYAKMEVAIKSANTLKAQILAILEGSKKD